MLSVLSEYLETGIIIPGTIVDRVFKSVLSPTDVLFTLYVRDMIMFSTIV